MIGTDGNAVDDATRRNRVDLVQGPGSALLDAGAARQEPGCDHRRAGLDRRDDPDTRRDSPIPSDLLSLTSQTDTLTINGRNYLSNYVAATRTFTDTTPANRQSTTTLDAQGRPIVAQLAGLEPTAVTYDSRRPDRDHRRGERRRSARTSAPRLQRRRLPRLHHRSAGPGGELRLRRRRTGDLADAARWRVVQYAYDANGNLTSLTPPGRPAHAFTHTPVDLMASYIPPNVGAGTNQTLYAYNARPAADPGRAARRADRGVRLRQRRDG